MGLLFSCQLIVALELLVEKLIKNCYEPIIIYDGP